MKETQLVRIKMLQMAVLTIAAGLISAQEGLTFRNTFDRMSVNAEKGPSQLAESQSGTPGFSWNQGTRQCRCSFRHRVPDL